VLAFSAFSLLGNLQAGVMLTAAMGGISFGVAPYGAPSQATPIFTFDNVTGFFDILASPGGGFLTANASAVNNLFETGEQNILGSVLEASQLGGNNGLGTFGYGQGDVTNNFIGDVSLSDSGPGGGTLSYGIFNTVDTFKQVGAFNGTIGVVLPIAGVVPFVNSASAASLIETVTDLTTGVVTGVPITAIGVAGNGRTSLVGSAGTALVTRGNAFSALAVSTTNANFADGDMLQVATVFTVFADPSSLDVTGIDPSLLEMSGATLPDEQFAQLTPAPEPGTILLGLAPLALVLFLRSRKAV
jgi:hypothetical protein